MTDAKGNVAGPAVDARGNPAIDPTANVIALNEAAVRRQDDLRAANHKYIDAALKHVEEIAILRSQHTRELVQLRAEHQKELAALAATTVARIGDRVAALEKSSDVGAGRLLYADPAMRELTMEMKRLGDTSAATAGRGAGSASTIAAIVSVGALLVMLATLAFTVLRAH